MSLIATRKRGQEGNTVPPSNTSSRQQGIRHVTNANRRRVLGNAVVYITRPSANSTLHPGGPSHSFYNRLPSPHFLFAFAYFASFQSFVAHARFSPPKCLHFLFFSFLFLRLFPCPSRRRCPCSASTSARGLPQTARRPRCRKAPLTRRSSARHSSLVPRTARRRA